jgi:bifunctional DNA-binding transcriptional regulator/antitoxin component of YhaV-PrlF toxin-antitoxin module
MAALSKPNGNMEMKVFHKGQVVIPVGLRKKYNINIGDSIQAIPSKYGILIKLVPKTKKSPSITDNLFGIFRNYTKGNKMLKKKEILEVTEKGFIEDLVK